MYIEKEEAGKEGKTKCKKEEEEKRSKKNALEGKCRSEKEKHRIREKIKKELKWYKNVKQEAWSENTKKGNAKERKWETRKREWRETY